MKVTGLPPGLRATQVDDPHVPAVTALLTAKEMAFFGRSDSNDKETLGALRAPELHGARGTTAVWQDQELIAVLLAYEDFERCRDLYLDMFIHPLAAHRQELASALLAAAAAYAREYDVPPQAWLKMESFHGDEQIEAALHAAGYRTHRVYQRMRLDFAAPPASPTPPAGVTVRTMREEDWHDMYEVVQSSFLDHYDFHPRTFEVFKRDALDETSDPGQWRLAFDGGTCIGVCMGSNRYAAHRLGYVETLGVLRAYRRRGSHSSCCATPSTVTQPSGSPVRRCTATPPTPPERPRLYEGLGLRRDQAYNAWRIELPTRVATASGR